ncbi:MAG TPA: diguanylate cyclase [Pseudomonadales bacterium]|nr:diguanylate cyclase [Pseudomonadales bacterium]
MLKVVHRPTVFIVDDDLSIRKIVSLMLGEYCIVEQIENGAEALQKASVVIPDLILLDVNMPGMDGYEVCKLLKADPATEHIAVIFITALDTNESEEQGLEIGAVDFIRKPISERIVQARVLNVLNQQATAQKLEHLARTDSLTGAFNHGHLMETGRKEVHRSKRYIRTVSVLMIDIDHFKSVNDTHGHGIGDDALIKTVEVMDGELRAEDMLGRLGGEEFAVILPETGKAGASNVAERLRIAVSDIVIKAPTGSLSFTISIGVAESDKQDDFQRILKRADDALYRAKRQGRNQVV